MKGEIDILRDAILAQNPTNEQRDAIFADELEFLLRAAPGSGKTWTSSRRFIWRGANWPYSSGGLALLSFTNAAIREFKTATITLGKRNLLADPNYVGTFDAFVDRFILTPFGHLLTGSDKRPKLLLEPLSGHRKNTQFKAWIDDRTPVFAWDIIPFPKDGKFAYKTAGFNSRELDGRKAVRQLMVSGFYTHGQRVYWACRLLFKRPYIAKVLARRFPEIIVDEAQDTNAWLLILLNFLREKGSKITLVGDPDQCIYEFSMADATSLPSLKEKWNVPEKPLSQSFRCNDMIADAVRSVGGNSSFNGCGYSGNNIHRAYVIRETNSKFSDSIRSFQDILNKAQIPFSSSAIICRAHSQLDAVRGEVNYTNLKGKTRELAKAAFFRDCRHDYKEAHKIVEKIMRVITPSPFSIFWEKYDENPNSEISKAVRLEIWKYVKEPTGLPPISQDGNIWIQNVRQGLFELMQRLGISHGLRVGNTIKKTGLGDAQLNLPLFVEQDNFPKIRQDTIHQVKGESIDAVLVVGGTTFWNSVVRAIETSESTEDRRLAYVAMTRARHLLLVALPNGHFNNNFHKWKSWGFELLP